MTSHACYQIGEKIAIPPTWKWLLPFQDKPSILITSLT